MMTGKENSAMTILMDFAKPCKGKLIGSVILAVLGALCGMIPYIAVSRGIIMICHEDYAFSKLAFLALIAFAGYLGQVWFGTFSTMKSHESAFIILRNIRMAITEKLSHVPMGTILDTPSGKFKTIIVDTVEKLELPLAHMVPELTANILIPVLMLVYLFSLDWRLALISLVTIPVGAFCYMGMMKDYEKRYARVLAAGKNMDAATVEYIGGIEVVKTFNQGERSYKKYADAVAENETAKVTWFKQTNGYYVMGLSILTATLVGVLPLGSWLFINGRVEAGTLITCIILALGLVKPLIQALQYTDSLAMVDSTVKEVGNLLDEPELVRPTERAVLADADVSFDHVTFRYKETEVLHGISFDCAKNGMTAIVGPSGSGKSTIARLIASFWEAESGCVRIGGVDVRNIPLPQIMELVSYVSQDNFLFHLSIRENIRIGKPEATDAEIEAAAKKASCHDFIAALPEGYDTLAGDAGSRLSGGERQRIAIARAIVNEPKVLLLDEPLGALDLKLRQDMQYELIRLKNELGITFIYVTHDQEEALTMSDTIVVMNQGYIQQVGTPEDIYNEPKNAFVADFIGDSNILSATMVHDRLVNILGANFPCVDEGFGQKKPVDAVIRPEDIDLVKPEDGMIRGVVTHVIFKGVHYEMEVMANNYEWLVHSTDMFPVGAEVGLRVDPFDIQIMKKPESEDEEAVPIEE